MTDEMSDDDLMEEFLSTTHYAGDVRPWIEVPATWQSDDEPDEPRTYRDKLRLLAGRDEDEAHKKAWDTRGRGQHGETTGEGRNADGSARDTYERPPVLKVNTVEEGIKAILEGHVVELAEVGHVHTVLEKLAAMAQDAKDRGEKAPNYDLCQVSVAGSNLFCGSKLKTAEFPNGVPRLSMPQLSGIPVPGSMASLLQPNQDGNVDGAVALVSHLQGLGIKTEKAKVAAASLRASQAELIGPKVARMMTKATYDPGEQPIFISRDGYVVDGHHRWAAVVGRDAKDNKLGDLLMNVIRVDAPISEVLHIANSWATQFGIAPEAGAKDTK